LNPWRELKTFASFNAVGLLSTAVAIPVMALLDGWGVPYPVYTALNFLWGIGLGFWLNFRFTFRQNRSTAWPALGRYSVTFFSLLAMVQCLQYGLIDVARWPRWSGVGMGMVVYGGLGYPISRFWVFRHDRMA